MYTAKPRTDWNKIMKTIVLVILVISCILLFAGCAGVFYSGNTAEGDKVKSFGIAFGKANVSAIETRIDIMREGEDMLLETNQNVEDMVSNMEAHEIAALIARLSALAAL